jgi:uncharacterized repeat protein (TIGR02543 family)
MAGSIHLIPGSDSGLAKGNKKITGIDEGKYYIVEEWDEDIMPVATPYQFVSSSGMRSENVSDIGRISGEAIIGLTNYHHYRVKTAQPFPYPVDFIDYPTSVSDTVTPNPDGIIDLPKPAAYNVVYYLSSPFLDFADYEIAQITADGSSKTAPRSSGSIMAMVASGTELDYVFYRDISPADPPYEAFVLKVKIEPPIPTDKVIVRFNLNYGTMGLYDTRFVTPGKTIDTDTPPQSMPAEPIRSGYTFDGWWTGDGGTYGWLTQFTETTPVANVPAPMDVYARWQLGGATLVTVTFAYNNGTTTTVTRTCAEGGTIDPPLPAAPTYVGYKFAGWWTITGTTPPAPGYTAGWDEEVTSGTTFDDDTTVYARWNPCFVVTFDSMGGSAVADMTCTPLDRLAALPTAPIRTGHTFVGWYLFDGTVTGVWGDPVTTSTTFTADTIVFARWQEVSTDEAKVGTITFALPTDPASTTTLGNATISAPTLNTEGPTGNTYTVTANVPAGFTNVRFKVGTHAPAASLVIGFVRNGGTPDIDDLLIAGNTLAITVIATYGGVDYSYVALVSIVP